MFKCSPDDKKLPSFLIPYDIDVKLNKKTASLMKEKNLTTLSQLPEISRFDTMR